MITTIPVASFDELVAEVRKLPGTWAFRGHRDARWKLASAIERSGSIDPVHDERNLLSEFGRHAGVYLPSQLVPTGDDVVGWLALMQHYGAPTRLLDFTMSPYIAAFFALEYPSEIGSGRRSVWALNIVACQLRSAEILLDAKIATSEDLAVTLVTSRQDLALRLLVYADKNVNFVLPIEPLVYDARQSAQQTIFMVPGTISEQFEANLMALEPHKTLAIQFVFPDSIRSEALEELRLMNVTAASLFPGLDGYGRSMHSHLTLRTKSSIALEKCYQRHSLYWADAATVILTDAPDAGPAPQQHPWTGLSPSRARQAHRSRGGHQAAAAFHDHDGRMIDGSATPTAYVSPGVSPLRSNCSMPIANRRWQPSQTTAAAKPRMMIGFVGVHGHVTVSRISMSCTGGGSSVHQSGRSRSSAISFPLRCLPRSRRVAFAITASSAKYIPWLPEGHDPDCTAPDFRAGWQIAPGCKSIPIRGRTSASSRSPE
jgi:hypothetical protein